LKEKRKIIRKEKDSSTILEEFGELFSFSTSNSSSGSIAKKMKLAGF
jgi:hypothetical protein